ncbi:MAG: CGNR zinc finger domain-containing protein [Marmoricola sp.]
MTTADLPRPEVPGPVAVVRDFVNTTDLETGSDELTTAADLTRYLVREGLLAGSARASSADLDLARRLRAGLRAALEQNHDGGTGKVAGLAPALHELAIGLDWSEDRPMLRPTAPGVRGALARIGLAVQEAADGGLWWRLKICSSDECAWAYYDHSKNRSRSWCEYGCGNKIKTRAYRARQRAASTR